MQWIWLFGKRLRLCESFVHVFVMSEQMKADGDCMNEFTILLRLFVSVNVVECSVIENINVTNEKMRHIRASPLERGIHAYISSRTRKWHFENTDIDTNSRRSFCI